jgi:ribosomal protein S27E
MLEDFASLAGLAFYATFVLTGSVSFGYLVLRLTYPEVREFSKEMKLGASAVLGIAIVALAALVDYYFGGQFFLGGLLPVMIFALLIASLGLFKALSMFFRPKYLTVGVSAPSPAAVLQKKSGKEKLLEIKKQLEPEVEKKVEEVSVQVPVYSMEGRAIAEKKLPEVTTSKEEAARRIARAKEVEAELAAREIFEEAREETRAQVSESQFESGKPVHRLYLLKPEERRVNVIAPKSLSERDEFGALVQDVYSQLKSEAPAPTPGGTPARTSLEARRAARVQARAQPVAQPQLSLSEVLGGGAPSVPEAQVPVSKPSPLFAELEKISAPAEKKEEKKEVGAFMKIEADKTMGCPMCHSHLSRIVFCPYCGAGFCANCSPSVSPREDSFIYVCPKCKEEVTVRKKQQ